VRGGRFLVSIVDVSVLPLKVRIRPFVTSDEKTIYADWYSYSDDCDDKVPATATSLQHHQATPSFKFAGRAISIFAGFGKFKLAMIPWNCSTVVPILSLGLNAISSAIVEHITPE
jgi:hypothetical protein